MWSTMLMCVVPVKSPSIVLIRPRTRSKGTASAGVLCLLRYWGHAHSLRLLRRTLARPMHWPQVESRNRVAARGLGMHIVRGQRAWTGSNRDDELCRWREAHGVDSGKGQEAKVLLAPTTCTPSTRSFAAAPAASPPAAATLTTPARPYLLHCVMPCPRTAQKSTRRTA